MAGEPEDVMVTLDFSELEGMLRPILQEVAQDAPSTSKADGAASVDQLTQRALARLWKLISDSEDDRAGHLAGVPLPEVDAELLPLQQEVDAALARLNARRLAVPAVVEAATRAKLEAERATLAKGADLDTDAGAKDTDAAMADAPAPEDGGQAPQADVEELLRKTTATTDRLPAIRARLDEALQRLQTNLAVLEEGDAGAAARRSPRTVEKVIMRAARTTQDAAERRRAAAAADGSANEAPGGGAGAGESGADATRRCLARELA